jgi:hypothetical protein
MSKAPVTLIRVRQLLADRGHEFTAPEHDGNSWAIVARTEHGAWALAQDWILTFHLGGDFTTEPYYEYWADSDLALKEIAEDIHDVISEFTSNTFPAKPGEAIVFTSGEPPRRVTIDHVTDDEIRQRLASVEPANAWIEYQSDAFRVWGRSTGDVMVEHTTTGESRLLQGDDATALQAEIVGIADHAGDRDLDPVEATDHYLSTEIFGRGPEQPATPGD